MNICPTPGPLVYLKGPERTDGANCCSFIWCWCPLVLIMAGSFKLEIGIVQKKGLSFFVCVCFFFVLPLFPRDCVLGEGNMCGRSVSTEDVHTLACVRVCVRASVHARVSPSVCSTVCDHMCVCITSLGIFIRVCVCVSVCERVRELVCMYACGSALFPRHSCNRSRLM